MRRNQKKYYFVQYFFVSEHKNNTFPLLTKHIQINTFIFILGLSQFTHPILNRYN